MSCSTVWATGNNIKMANGKKNGGKGGNRNLARESVASQIQPQTQTHTHFSKQACAL